MTRKPRTMSTKDARQLFAGELDYANVTEFRESLLKSVSDLERSPTKRYLVTKHGKPLAVFLSFDAFEALRKLFESLLAEEAKKDVSQVLAEASQRMDRDYGVVRPERGLPEGAGDVPEDVAGQLQALRDEQARLRSQLNRVRACESSTL